MYKHNINKLISGKLYSLKLQNCTFSNEYCIGFPDSRTDILNTLIIKQASEKIRKNITNNPNYTITVIYLNSVKCNLCNDVSTKYLRCLCCHNFLYQNKNIYIYDHKKVVMFPNGFQTHYLVNQLKML